tara:strand:- start:714 stop:1709 length:996 start_codon:yes stop_codon:yes gene_type:complete
MTGRVLITGGLGFIGLHLARRLVQSDYSVTLIDNMARGVVDSEAEKLFDHPLIEFQKVDLLDRQTVLELGSGFSTIFHLAAIIGVAHVSKQPYHVLTANTTMLDNILELARRQDALKRVLFSSTSEVYAGTLKQFGLDIPTAETAALAVSDLSEPRTSYMLSKIMGEALCHHASVPTTIFRPHNIYGPRMGMSHVIPEQLERAWRAKEGDSVPVYSPTHSRSFCYIDDAVEMLFRMMSYSSAEGKTLNLGVSGPEIRMQKLAILCHEVTGKCLGITPMQDTLGSPPRRAPDMTRTNALLEFEPTVSLENGIKRTWDWYQSNVFGNNKRSAC